MTLLETLWKIAKTVLSEVIETDSDTDGPGLPPVVSPAKQAEEHWPTTSERSGSAAAWPPFSGHRIPLGGDGR